METVNPGVMENNVKIEDESATGKKNGVQISLRSENVQEVISRRNSFVTRWALLLFLLILLLLLAASWFIRYPDLIQANAILIAANAPKEIVVKQDGKLIKLFVNNDDLVTESQIIGWMESTGNHEEILLLSQLLNTSLNYLDKNESEKIVQLFTDKKFRNLGELQTAYQQYITSLQLFNDYLVNGYYHKRKLVLLEDYAYLQKMHTNLESQKQLLLQDLELTKETFDANDSLLKYKAISKQEYREHKGNLINKQITIPQLESSLLTNDNLQIAKKKEIDELEHSISQAKIVFQQSLQTLKSSVEDWIKKYTLIAPVTGKVAFIIPLQQNQYLLAGKTIGFVNPGDSRYYAQLNLPQDNFGKIAVGQSVQLHLDAYPYQEFGFVEGKLAYIAKVPSDSGFLATMELTNGLVTNLNTNIQYRSGLKSQALIITKNSRLLQKFYYNIIKGLHR